MGPDASDLEAPEDLLVYQHVLFLSSAATGSDSLPLFSPTMLLCGQDRNHSGFKAEPIWSFELDDLQEFEPYLTSAEFVVDLPPAAWTPDGSSEELDWDNPDLDRHIVVRLQSFPEWPDEESPLHSLDGLNAVDVAEGDPVGIADEGPPQFRIPIDLVTLRAWIAASENDEATNLAFQLSDASDSGMLRLYALNSRAPQDTIPPPARLKISYFDGQEQDFTLDCAKNAQVLSRPDAGQSGGIELSTGITTFRLLQLDLPEELRSDSLMILRARLYLYPDLDHFAGVGGHDRDADGLSMRVIAPREALDLENLAIPEDDFLGLAGALDVYTAQNQAAEPLALPITPWVQNWITGDEENHGLLLALNGEDERPRCLSFFIDEPGKDPKLEIFYARRPDFD